MGSRASFICRSILTLVFFTIVSTPQVFAHGSGALPPDIGTRGAGTRAIPPNPGTFVNFEVPHVHPLDLSPDGSTLIACNTPDDRIEIFSVDGLDGSLTHTDSIPVGYGPEAVRFRSNTEVWVVNHVSDSVSIVDLSLGFVTNTIQTDDEPADVVFYTDAGNSANLAAVSCSRPDKIQVFNADTLALVDELDIFSEDPRALATDGTNVYVAAFASGNSTTIIANNTIANALEDATGPYGGQNPPFNDGVPGTAWVTPFGSDDFGSVFAPPPQVSLVVRKDFNDGDKWKDDNGADWTSWISGANAAKSLRVTGWDMTDNDIASFSTTNGTTALNAGFGASGWVTRRMNACMALGINPNDGSLLLVGTDSTNEVRFEPNINGTFIQVLAAINNGTTGAEIALVDMNEAHLDAAQGGVGMAYSDPSVPQSERDKSIGDPRGVAYNPAGTRAYVSGMGSGNIVVLDPATGARLGGLGHTIDVGFGPTGIVHHGTLNRLYVLNKFDATVSVVDTTTLGAESVTQTIPYYDPTPGYINTGRVHFYDTHQNSGLGQIACASCHIDGRNDQLAWDLGNPQGAVKPTVQVNPAGPAIDQQNLFLNGFIEPFDDFHDMKGPMTTQTLIDIIGHEPFHWRGDRDGIEEFAGAFATLQGDDVPLPATPMQEFEDFLSSLHFLPNPFRAMDNSLPGGPKFVGAGTNPLLPLDGYFSNGPTSNNPGLSARGTPLPDGDAFRGFQLYIQGNPLHTGANPHAPEPLDSQFQCVTCHSLPTGAGSVDLAVFNGLSLEFDYVDIAPGPLGERHMALFPQDGTGNTDGVTGSPNQGSFTIPQLRNQLDKHGFNVKLANASTLGFGVLHDGSIDDLDTFLGSNAFDVDNDQDVADLIAFVLCINGDGFGDLAGLPGAPNFFSPPALPINLATVGQLGPDGGATQTAHAATGKQVTINSATPPAPDQSLIDLFVALAQSNAVDLIAKGTKDGNRRGWYLTSGTTFQSDNNGETIGLGALMALAGSGTELTFTVVPEGSGQRMGVDRDEDGFFDYREFLDGTDPADPASKGVAVPVGEATGDALLVFALTLLAAAVLRRRRWAFRRIAR